MLTHRESMSEPSMKFDTQQLDTPLSSFGFEIDELSAEKVSGHLLITPKCCQPFHVLHGGVSALIAEGISSMGASFATGGKRIAGVQLSINHHKSAKSGDYIVAEATPLSKGKSVHVWDVRITKEVDPNNPNPETRTLIASSKVTIFCFDHGSFTGMLKHQSKL